MQLCVLVALEDWFLRRLLIYLHSVRRSRRRTDRRAALKHYALHILAATADHPADDERMNVYVACDVSETHLGVEEEKLQEQ